MNKRQLLTIMMMGAMPLAALAQRHVPESAMTLPFEEGRRLCTEGHYYAASRSLTKYIDSEDKTHASEAEALRLVCDYYLNTPGTSAAIEEWTSSHPASPDVERLQLLHANMLVREGKYDEALAIYGSCEGDNLSQSEADEVHLYEAIAYIHTNQLGYAKNLLAQLSDSKTHKIDVLYYTAYVHYAEGDYTSALPDFEAVSHTSDYRAKAPVYLADCYMQTGNTQKAYQLIQDYTTRYPDSELTLEASRIKGELLYLQGKYPEAQALLSQYARGVESPKRTALYRLGMSYYNMRQYEQAAASLSESASSARDEMAQNAWLHSGISYISQGKTGQARIAFQQASEMGFSKQVQEEALYNYALTLHQGAQSGFGESVGVFERFLNAFPDSRYSNSVGQHLTEVYFTTKNYPAALASINKIKSPGSEILAAKQKVLYNLGVQEFTSSRFSAAESYMTQSIQLGKYDAQTLADAYYWRGESRYRQANYSAAISDLQQHISTTTGKGKNKALALYSLGYAQFKQKHYTAARPHFEAFLAEAAKPALSSQISSAMRADVSNRLADCLFTAKQYDQAYQSYQQALATDASGADYSLYQQALISGLKGDYTKKVQLLSQINTQYKDSQYGADALYEQGRAYVQTGARQQAMDTFASLIERYPQSANARRACNEIGMIYYESGQVEASVNAYRQVLERYPNTAEAETALANLKDIYTSQGKINEYAALADKAGKRLSNAELDQMVSAAANRAMANGEYAQALAHYRQLAEQTQSEDMRLEAMTGQLRSAYANKDYASTIDVATRMMQDLKVSPDVKAEAQLLRAESYLQTNRPVEAVADLKTLSSDTRTVYGAQATIRLAQYAYDTKQYQSAETVLLTFIDSGTTHAYWLARGFVLLSDVYMATDRKVEARQYLLSLKSNYTENEEINKMVEERLK